MDAHREVTTLLAAARDGDPGALDAVFALLYDELRRLARFQIADAADTPTLNATAVVHEVYLKFLGHATPSLADRAHFLRLAARAMRQVVVDHARARLAQKRGGGARHELLDEGTIAVAARAAEIVELDAALDGLQTLDPRLAEVVTLRFFAGRTCDEVAELLGVTDRTVQRDWRKARAYLHAALAGEDRP